MSSSYMAMWWRQMFSSSPVTLIPSRLGQAEDNLVEFLADFLTDEHGAAVDDPRHLKEGGTVLVERQLALLTDYRVQM